MFNDETRTEIERVADGIGAERAALLAIAEVESAGKAFATVGGRKEPLIRFEGHYFDRRVSVEKRAEARAAGLADPKAGAVRNPASQAARWALLARAAAIDHKAAHESVSWGLGQVMGAHWAWLGYADVDALVAEARAGVGGQAALMARYIDKAGLTDAIRRRDWPAFARGYNGPDYKRHGYDRKIASAYARYANGAPDVTGPRPLREGSRGDAVRDLQAKLTHAGYVTGQDGIFGGETERAVRAFQSAQRLPVDGIAGPVTMAALDREWRNEMTPPGFWPWFASWLRNVWKDD
jgi:murein L,D-transpeptidase YcbB/YkuD